MKNFWAVFVKEMKSYLVSPVAYVMAAVFLFISGFFFQNLVMSFNAYCFQWVQQSGHYGGEIGTVNLNQSVVVPFFGVLSFISLFVVPMLTMRLYAEEQKGGTMELLLTSPITTAQTAAAKFCACFCLYSAIVVLSMAFLGLLEIYGNPEWGPVISGYIGLLLMGASFVAIGLLASSLTENQVIAVALSFCALLLFWLIGWSASHAGPTLAKVLSYLSITQHLQDFQRGVVDTKDVVFYASLILVGLFLTVTVIESRRWRR